MPLRRSQRLSRLGAQPTPLPYATDSLVRGSKQKTKSEVYGLDTRPTQHKVTDQEPENLSVPVELTQYVPPPFNYAEAISHISRTHQGRLRQYTQRLQCEPFLTPPLASRLTATEVGDPAFRSLCRAILSQQISTKAANSIQMKFVQTLVFGAANSVEGKIETTTVDVYPTPTQVLAAGDDTLRGCGLSARKVIYIKDLAVRFLNGELSAQRLLNLSDVDVANVLLPIKGIGQWTVDMFLLFELKRTDIFPTGDLGVQKGFALLFNMEVRKTHRGKLLDPALMTRLAEPWRPYRSLATYYLWKIAGLTNAAS